MDKGKIVVGMSGGVDSSMSLLLLKRAGWEPTGVTLMLPRWEGCGSRENACCTEESIRVAKSVCDRLGVEHHVFDVREDFRHSVMDYLASELREGRTPNPCAECNRTLKFRKLFEFAASREIGYVATGHYARSRINPATGLGELLRARDSSKDQTYGLCFLGGAQLAKTVFPLGDMRKADVFLMAKNEGFDVFEKKKQSQDLCFVSGKDLPRFIEEKIGLNPGPIIDTSGTTIGEHRGLHFFTVGQRKRLGLRGQFFVKALDRKSNTLIVTKDRGDNLQHEAVLARVHFISGDTPRDAISVDAQARYHQPPVRAALYPQRDGLARIEFEAPIEAVTPGQVCAFYDGERCLGGGNIVG